MYFMVGTRMVCRRDDSVEKLMTLVDQDVGLLYLTGTYDLHKTYGHAFSYTFVYLEKESDRHSIENHKLKTKRP